MKLNSSLSFVNHDKENNIIREFNLPWDANRVKKTYDGLSRRERERTDNMYKIITGKSLAELLGIAEGY